MKMKFNSIYFMSLLAGMAFLLPGCNDDDVIEDDPDYSSERLFMPMFRVQANTNDSSDPYASTIASEATYCTSTHVNDIQLYWYGVTGASGYQIQSRIGSGSWDIPSQIVLDTIVGPDVLEFLDEDLQYSTTYRYAIRALSPKGEAYNSKWYGHGDGSHQNDYVGITTGDRYEVPSLFWAEDCTETSVVVKFNATAESGYQTTYKSFLEAGGEVVDGEWVFDEIRVEPTGDNADLPSVIHKMTDEDFERGYVQIDGLTSNAAYVITGQNNNTSRYYDRQYNKTQIRMFGTPGDPVIIPATVGNDTLLAQYYVPDLQVTRIDTVLSNYMSDNTMAEGQKFYLEGGKSYYISTDINLVKGFTLETNPDDLASKGRAKVYLGIGFTSESKIAGNARGFNLGRAASSGVENGMVLTIQDITFNEINFQPQYYYNYLDKNGTDGNSKLTISANYFINMNNQGLSFYLSALNITNCTFRGLTRGFIRFQGPNRETIEHLNVEGCVFTDCGVYDTNGRGYSWFAGPGNNRNSNFYRNLVFRNNTILDSPRHALVTENGNLAWPTGTTWNITIENNTFVNFSPRSTSSGHGLLFETRYAPAGSKINIRKNLFVMVRKGDSDKRNLYMRGIRINTKNIQYDIADNYATTVPNWTTSKLTDGLFTNYAFSLTSEGAGYNNGALNLGGFDETKIKFGDNVNGNEDDAVGYELTPEELFKDPAPLATNGYKDMHRHNVDGFYYNNTDKVKNHPIYTKNIGDPRWKTGAAWE
jgi:hypothetical protein